MPSDTRTAPVSKTRRWTGNILRTLAVLFLLFDGAIKLTRIAPVVESFDRLGYPLALGFGIGILELACVAAYVIPRTSVLGAILLTGFLGGATASQVQIGEPLWSHVLFPTYIGLLVWGGLLLSDDRLSSLVLLRRRPERRKPDPQEEAMVTGARLAADH